MKKENKIKKWFRKNAAMFALATANVEKDILGQKDPDGADVSHTLNVEQGTLADDLKRGIVSEAVMELRWRMYATISESENFTRRYKGKDKNGKPIFESVYLTPEVIKDLLSKVKIDEPNKFPLELVVDNTPITIASNNAMDFELEGELTKSINEDGDEIITHGSVKGEDLILKPENPIKIERNLLPKFEIEKYAKKMRVRTISDNEKLLEFVFSKFPDEFDRKTRLFVSELKRAMETPRSSSIIEISEVGFITNKTLGAKDLLQYHYRILGFDKIIEFDEHYVMKFKAKPLINGESIVAKYDGGKLQEKYKKKEARKTNI